jgi:hypothetical protein
MKTLAPCEGCGEPTHPHFSKFRNRDVYRCARCQLKSLALAMEEPCPGETVADISSGEQLGAWLRDLASDKNPVNFLDCLAKDDPD